MLQWQKNLHQELHLHITKGAIGVAMVEIDAETIIEMEVVLGLIGVIIMEIVLVHTESLDIERFMYYELWAEGLIISVGWFLKLEAKR